VTDVGFAAERLEVPRALLDLVTERPGITVGEAASLLTTSRGQLLELAADLIERGDLELQSRGRSIELHPSRRELTE